MSKISKEKKIQKLTPLQFEVTQNNATEPPFQNKYYDNEKPGIYVDIISEVPLFSSTDKFKSGCGWPSFLRPIESDCLEYIEDLTHGMKRVEVRSKSSGSHLGHVFDDGPPPDYKRYCINSASLRFIAKENLKDENLEEYLKYF